MDISGSVFKHVDLVLAAILCLAPAAAWLTVPAAGRQRRIVLLALAGLAIVLFGWSQRLEANEIRVYVH